MLLPPQPIASWVGHQWLQRSIHIERAAPSRQSLPAAMTRYQQPMTHDLDLGGSSGLISPPHLGRPWAPATLQLANCSDIRLEGPNLLRIGPLFKSVSHPSSQPVSSHLNLLAAGNLNTHCTCLARKDCAVNMRWCVLVVCLCVLFVACGLSAIRVPRSPASNPPSDATRGAT